MLIFYFLILLLLYFIFTKKVNPKISDYEKKQLQF
jgi:hypothetical protein